MLEELERRLAALSEVSGQLEEHWEPILQGVKRDIARDVEGELVELLVRLAEGSMLSSSEYGHEQAGPLRDHLKNNLSSYVDGRPAHVRINEESETFTTLFDPDYAGTPADFDQGKYPSSARPEQRLFGWKYGIYMPSVEGGWVSSRLKGKDYPTYAAVIERRIGDYKKSAPYWYFIEYGNAGQGAPYPTVAPNPFISRFRDEAEYYIEFMFRERIRKAKDLVTKSVLDSIKMDEQSRLIAPSGEEVYLDSWRTAQGKTHLQFRTKGGQFAKGAARV